MLLLFILSAIIFSAFPNVKLTICNTMLDFVDQSQITTEDMDLCQEICGDLSHIFNENVELNKHYWSTSRKIEELKRNEHYTKKYFEEDLSKIEKNIDKYKRYQKYHNKMIDSYTKPITLVKIESLNPIRNVCCDYYMYHNTKSHLCALKVEYLNNIMREKQKEFENCLRQISEEINVYNDKHLEIYCKWDLNKTLKEKNIGKLISILHKYSQHDKEYEFTKTCINTLDYIQYRMNLHSTHQNIE